MKIFRFICWIRGFHQSSWVALSHDKDTNKNYGTCGECMLCGKIPAGGAMVDSRMRLIWWKEPTTHE